MDIKLLPRFKAFAVHQWKGAAFGLVLGISIAFFLQAFQTPSSVTPLDRIWSGIDVCKPLLYRGTRGTSVQVSDVGHKHQAVAVGVMDATKASESDEKRLASLVALWEASSALSLRDPDDPLVKSINISPSESPRAPHLENCSHRSVINVKLDSWGENGTWPLWTLWKGQGMEPDPDSSFSTYTDSIKNQSIFRRYPPWVVGADEDNLPLTRTVQADMWQHQHPRNCEDSNLRFLLADWETDPGFGMGAQIASMAGLLAIAINEERVLVSSYFNRADHDECLGNDRGHWSCYFLSETSNECRNRALFLATQSSAWEQGLITHKNNYSSRHVWTGKVPRRWGKPWEFMQPTTQIGGKLLIHHKALDRRWWRAQAVRYLMRFPSEYMCSLLNVARHNAFGVKAAQMVLDSLPVSWPEVSWSKNETEIDKFVWATHRPWVPRPLISMHVRQGDKAKEMKIAAFKDYMGLAYQLRNRFPHARSIWLSTEMEEVIEESELYANTWDIYYTNVSRQTGNMSMPAYEASLGRTISTNYPLVNFLLAADADFFIGALGSTWCYLIDGMRTTGGRVMSGYLSVNKYRFW